MCVCAGVRERKKSELERHKSLSWRSCHGRRLYAHEGSTTCCENVVWNVRTLMRRVWPGAPAPTICNRSDTVVQKSPQRLFDVRAGPFNVSLGESRGCTLIRVSSNLVPPRTARSSARHPKHRRRCGCRKVGSSPPVSQLAFPNAWQPNRRAGTLLYIGSF